MTPNGSAWAALDNLVCMAASMAPILRYSSRTVTTTHVSAKDLRQQLAEHLDAVLAGESFLVTRSGRPTAQLVPIETRSKENGADE
jgi:prevent-host-death family protein